jgi:two-component system, chemotaxis family, chemotaxis protein CheY
VEDDFTSRLFLQEVLRHFAETHIAMNGREALTAFQMSLDAKAPYDLICLDIMMPEMDGLQALKEIRAVGKKIGVRECDRIKIVTITALADSASVMAAILEHCNGYLIKPLNKASVLEHLQKFGLIEQKNP